MTEDEIRELVASFDGVAVTVASEAGGAPEVAWGDTFFFYDPDGDIPDDRRFPFATIVTGNYPGFDEASDLDRPGAFRLNAWVGAETFAAVIDEDREHDFAALDTPMPHPIYGAQSWVSIVNPGPATAELLSTLLDEAHRRAVARHDRRGER